MQTLTRPLFEKSKQNKASLGPFKRLSISSETQNGPVFTFNMTTNLYEFMPPFPLYLNLVNAQNPARKHFEKTSSIIVC